MTAPTFTGLDDTAKDQAVKVGFAVYSTPAPTSYAAGAQSYTAGDLCGGIIVHDGTGNANGTLPTGAALVAAIPSCRVGDTIYCLISNGANASGTITLVASTGVNFDANQGGGSHIIPFSASKDIICRVTNVTPGSQAYTVYS